MPFIIDEDILFQCLPGQELGAFPGCVQPLALQGREYQVVFTAGVQAVTRGPRVSHSKEKPSSAPVLTLWLPEKECQREDLTCDLCAYPLASLRLTMPLIHWAS